MLGDVESALEGFVQRAASVSVLQRQIVGTLKLAKNLGDRVGRRVKVLSQGGDDRDFLEGLFIPFSILTINTIWLPDGSRETKVILNGRRPWRNPVDFEVVKKLARELKSLTLRIEFED